MSVIPPKDRTKTKGPVHSKKSALKVRQRTKEGWLEEARLAVLKQNPFANVMKKHSGTRRKNPQTVSDSQTVISNKFLSYLSHAIA